MLYLIALVNIFVFSPLIKTLKEPWFIFETGIKVC